ncbi:mitochondrial thiamine pyrophosphate carrier 1 [Cryphonectria parasitica EP155]|uniref:Mitochondrial thiamine pyrophosphate carrier 1 n=1 Tax=Cryphonectria parasitica (strain ATCC 38755 / EP155) TaxID=660469 RepID=A0A9P4Y9R6_CRYP1|nr:mitochondrial thiamine pyrophosphate carrier 1 [Cryphonectria parasitica EP155]KAF3769004.1 mitochondrial thiamine pyrophosphate carrier 1 [Cryphonectria parasitica EP155]
MSPKGEQLKDEGSRLQVVVAGATAGMISRFIIAPLDVVKIRLQLQSHSLSDPLSHPYARGGPIYKGTIPTIKTILATEGLTGLWKGNVPAELMYISYSAIQFTTYRSTTQLLQHLQEQHGVKIPGAAETFIAGASAGAVGTAATYPLDLLRTRFAAQGNDDRVYTSLRRAIATIRRDEGARGFFRGLSPALSQIVPFMGAFFSVYEALRTPLSQLSLPFAGGEAVAGTLASIIAKTGVFPLDTVRKRIQVQGPTRSRYVHKNIPDYSRLGTVGTIRTILRTEGMRGLYRGLTVSLFKAAPASAITVWTYERVLKALISLEGTNNDKKVL